MEKKRSEEKETERYEEEERKEDIAFIVESSFLDYSTYPPQQIEQTENFYFDVHQINFEYPEKTKVEYHYLFPNWINNEYENILDSNDDMTVKQAISSIRTLSQNRRFYSTILFLCLLSTGFMVKC